LTARPTSTAATALVTEEIGEDVLKLAEDVTDAHAGEISRATLQAGVPEAVIRRPLLFVAQHRVGLRGLLELDLGVFVALVSIRMEFEGGLSIRALDVFVARILGEPQNFVVISLGAHRGCSSAGNGRLKLRLN